ncbi:RAD51-associated protein 2 [Tachyglossus aculeatus]|uniref:RAD51-associated protein 2 n=1 Tax=Tachyglossus aculeatus TaxID=9261 RepID=UPI0018F49D49|nr:RAD51-associated protein 2 [Tachyglossus aculeatus]
MLEKPVGSYKDYGTSEIFVPLASSDGRCPEDRSGERITSCLNLDLPFNHRGHQAVRALVTSQLNNRISVGVKLRRGEREGQGDSGLENFHQVFDIGTVRAGRQGEREGGRAAGRPLRRLGLESLRLMEETEARARARAPPGKPGSLDGGQGPRREAEAGGTPQAWPALGRTGLTQPRGPAGGHGPARDPRQNSRRGPPPLNRDAELNPPGETPDRGISGRGHIGMTADPSQAREREDFSQGEKLGPKGHGQEEPKVQWSGGIQRALPETEKGYAKHVVQDNCDSSSTTSRSLKPTEKTLAVDISEAKYSSRSTVGTPRPTDNVQGERASLYLEEMNKDETDVVDSDDVYCSPNTPDAKKPKLQNDKSVCAKNTRSEWSERACRSVGNRGTLALEKGNKSPIDFHNYNQSSVKINSTLFQKQIKTTAPPYTVDDEDSEARGHTRSLNECQSSESRNINSTGKRSWGKRWNYNDCKTEYVNVKETTEQSAFSLILEMPNGDHSNSSTITMLSCDKTKQSVFEIFDAQKDLLKRVVLNSDCLYITVQSRPDVEESDNMPQLVELGAVKNLPSNNCLESLNSGIGRLRKNVRRHQKISNILLWFGGLLLQSKRKYRIRNLLTRSDNVNKHLQARIAEHSKTNKMESTLSQMFYDSFLFQEAENKYLLQEERLVSKWIAAVKFHFYINSVLENFSVRRGTNTLSESTSLKLLCRHGNNCFTNIANEEIDTRFFDSYLVLPQELLESRNENQDSLLCQSNMARKRNLTSKHRYIENRLLDSFKLNWLTKNLKSYFQNKIEAGTNEKEQTIDQFIFEFLHYLDISKLELGKVIDISGPISLEWEIPTRSIIKKRRVKKLYGNYFFPRKFIVTKDKKIGSRFRSRVNHKEKYPGYPKMYLTGLTQEAWADYRKMHRNICIIIPKNTFLSGFDIYGKNPFIHFENIDQVSLNSMPTYNYNEWSGKTTVSSEENYAHFNLNAVKSNKMYVPSGFPVPHIGETIPKYPQDSHRCVIELPLKINTNQYSEREGKQDINMNQYSFKERKQEVNTNQYYERERKQEVYTNQYSEKERKQKINTNQYSERERKQELQTFSFYYKNTRKSFLIEPHVMAIYYDDCHSETVYIKQNKSISVIHEEQIWNFLREVKERKYDLMIYNEIRDPENKLMVTNSYQNFKNIIQTLRKQKGAPISNKDNLLRLLASDSLLNKTINFTNEETEESVNQNNICDRNPFQNNFQERILTNLNLHLPQNESIKCGATNHKLTDFITQKNEYLQDRRDQCLSTKAIAKTSDFEMKNKFDLVLEELRMFHKISKENVILCNEEANTDQKNYLDKSCDLKNVSLNKTNAFSLHGGAASANISKSRQSSFKWKTIQKNAEQDHLHKHSSSVASDKELPHKPSERDQRESTQSFYPRKWMEERADSIQKEGASYVLVHGIVNLLSMSNHFISQEISLYGSLNDWTYCKLNSQFSLKPEEKSIKHTVGTSVGSQKGLKLGSVLSGAHTLKQLHLQANINIVLMEIWFKIHCSTADSILAHGLVKRCCHLFKIVFDEDGDL